MSKDGKKTQTDLKNTVTNQKAGYGGRDIPNSKRTEEE